jgi:hypothetical protein
MPLKKSKHTYSNNKIMKKEIAEELKTISPNITEKDLASGRPSIKEYNLPQGYFDRMTASVMQQIQLQPQPQFATNKKSKATTLLQTWIKWLTPLKTSLAFGTIALVLIGTYQFLNQTQIPQTTNTEEANTEAVHQYIINHLDEIDEEELIDLHTKPLANEIQQPIDHYKDIPNEEVEKYLKQGEL